ncbi:hypothetical protein G3I77_38230 [Streptomyces sp. D2-8]|uniref:VOC family protein n=1 Tax=Streptomyces sp. D2-8 TaxID=2707767 RepID=UPI0020BE3A62|nr:VOC family protein [Streptomyces sp. D2-8]MCK8438620.1 hypothetical protein [Streptomyces sp. D2-8]
MVSVVQNVAIDCSDAYELARFWTLVADRRKPDGAGWAVLADPEGNEFCVLRSDSDRAAMSS